MSSATSIESSQTSRTPDATLRPWQFFLLAGMLSATAVVIAATGQSPAAIITLSLTVVAASLVALGVYRALVPLVTTERTEEPAVGVGRKRAALEREKALVMRSIKELEFDFAMGKIAQADFDEMIGRLRSRAIGLMRQIDEGVGYRGAIEEELRSRLAAQKRRGAEASTALHPSAAAESPGPPLAASESPVARGFSPATSDVVTATCDCGVVNDADAKFCKNCGTRLAPA